MIYDMVIIALASLLDTPVFLHHRSFRYIDRRSHLMALETLIGGQRLTHIFLCRKMESSFLSRYRPTANHMIVSNAFYNPPVQIQGRDPHNPLRIGLLSNLCHEKGLTDFIAILDKGVKQGLPLQGILAGPPFYAAALETIKRSLSRFDGILEWRGAIDGNEKERFYQDIDVFLFPTRYANEAQPVVVFEALSRGLPTVAFGRGCIPSDLDENSGLVVPPGTDFGGQALAILKRFIDEPGLWHRYSRAGIARVSELHDIACRQFENLEQALFSGGPYK